MFSGAYTRVLVLLRVRGRSRVNDTRGTALEELISRMRRLIDDHRGQDFLFGRISRKRKKRKTKNALACDLTRDYKLVEII